MLMHLEYFFLYLQPAIFLRLV